MPPRDVLLTVGKEIMSAPMSFRCRVWEYLAYHPLMQRYFDEDPEFRWEQAPRPRLTDDDYQAGYFDEITIDERLRRTAALDFVTTENELVLRGHEVERSSSAQTFVNGDFVKITRLIVIIRQSGTWRLLPTKLGVFVEVTLHQWMVSKVLPNAAPERHGRRHNFLANGQQHIAWWHTAVCHHAMCC